MNKILRPAGVIAACAWVAISPVPTLSAPAENAAALRPVVSILITTQTGVLPSYVGTVSARTETSLGFPLSGTLAERPVDAGDVVTRNQVLAQLDPEKIDANVWAAKANVIVARQGVASTFDAMQRTHQLLARNVEGKAALEETQRALASARARLEQASATLARAQDMRASTTLHAPQDGIVTAVFADAGSAVSAGQPVLRLAGTKGREITLDMTDPDIKKLPAQAQFLTQLLAIPTITAPARLASVDPVAARRTRTRRVHLAVGDLPAAYRLGALVRITPEGSPKSHISLPESAILTPPSGAFVWRIVRPSGASRGTIVKTPVTFAPTLAKAAFILSGLSVGDEVLIKGVHSVKSGQKVGKRVAK